VACFRSIKSNGALLAATSLALVTLTSVSHAYTQDQAQRCTGDAMRLCSAEIPDVDRITACMAKKKAQLSEGSRAVFKVEPSERTTSVNYANKPPKSGWRNYWGWGD